MSPHIFILLEPEQEFFFILLIVTVSLLLTKYCWLELNNNKKINILKQHTLVFEYIILS